jgi:hypothetical protein
MLCCGALMTLMAMIATPSSDAAVITRGRTMPSRVVVQRPVIVRNGFVPFVHDRVVFVPRFRSRVVFFCPGPFFVPFPVVAPSTMAYAAPYLYPAPYTAPPQAALTDAASSDVLGYHWARDLRQDIATWDGFVAYVKAHVLEADPKLQLEFERGFVHGYGVNGVEAFDKAMSDARAQPALAGGSAGP